MELPKNEITFHVDMVGDTTFKRYEGMFTVRCVLNMGQKHALELDKTRLLGNYANPTQELIGLALIFANIRARVIEAPEWWKQSGNGLNFNDENVLVEIYNKALDAEDEWRQKVKTLANPPEATESQAPTT